MYSYIDINRGNKKPVQSSPEKLFTLWPTYEFFSQLKKMSKMYQNHVSWEYVEAFGLRPCRQSEKKLFETNSPFF